MADQRLIYKILTEDQWQTALTQNIFKGASVDLADGYIHFSTAKQTRETVAKHFHGQKNLVLLAVDATLLGDDLKWEPSRGGALFPHLYADLCLQCIVETWDLKDNADGSHEFPEAIP
ncbi:MAG: DUF952 domain-containing protein [Pseudomonadota bacterium]